VAKGEPSEDSDLDVLVESGDAVKSLSFKNRMNIAYDVLFASDLPFGCDLIIWTSDELAEKQHLDSLFFNSVWKNKMVIHGN
jgi:predicted nucleotidyltransferase